MKAADDPHIDVCGAEFFTEQPWAVPKTAPEALDHDVKIVSAVLQFVRRPAAEFFRQRRLNHAGRKKSSNKDIARASRHRRPAPGPFADICRRYGLQSRPNRKAWQRRRRLKRPQSSAF